MPDAHTPIRIHDVATLIDAGDDFGGGCRTVVAFNPGRKWVRLLCVGTLEVAKRELAAFDRARRLAGRLAPRRRLGHKIDRKRKLYKRLGVRRNDKLVRAVARALIAAP